MTKSDRRDFLKSAMATIALAAGPGSVRKALAQPGRSGTIQDVKHVVILMQENRSFDHYFGSLRGVRGFSDPRPLILPSGKPVWHQRAASGKRTITPFRLNSRKTAAQAMESLDHSWKGSHARWKNHDAWIDAKGPLTMGYFTREDMPFYYALADAFTICDDYHCSIFGPTNPNRMFLFTGTNGLAVGNDGPQAIINPPDETNETADPKNDAAGFKPYTWTTYAERLEDAGVDWRVYQEYDNYGDNALAYFARFRGAEDSDLYRRARSWAESSNAQNAKQSRGEHLVKRFADDIAAGRLPQVSWIVAPTLLCEHPAACPAYGEQLTANLLAALAAHPEVWAETVFLINYDENDGFFDHVPPPVPATGPALGKSSVAPEGETYHGEPVGLGPRVPMIVASPWSKGGFVNSELFDHTSVIRFLEKRFGVMEPNITPWRRAMCGDLISAFDFTAEGLGWEAQLPDTAGYNRDADLAHRQPPVQVPKRNRPALQETGSRPARPLPYAFEVKGQQHSGQFHLSVQNTGAAGVHLVLYSQGGKDGPWHYSVAAGETLSDSLPVGQGKLGLTLHGPNGFLRGFSMARTRTGLTVESSYDAADQCIVLRLRHDDAKARTVAIRARDYGTAAPRLYQLRAGKVIEDRWPLAQSNHWYDLEVRSGDAAWRLAGHYETGRISSSDPAIGRTV
jgi:phospholipase C